MKKNLLLILLLVGLIACSNKNAETEQLTISAAASLKDVLTEINEQYRMEYPASNVQLNFGSSGTLKRQIEQGAPVDVFISASIDHFNSLVTKGLVDPERHTELVSNRLVVITPLKQEGVTEIVDLQKPEIDKIAIGTPETVPAGKYSEEALVALNLWGKIEEKLVFTKDVRQVLTYTESGNVDAGIVYETDAKQSEGVEIISIIDEANYTKIIYPAGVIKTSDNIDETVKFYEFLQGEKAREIFQQFGFKLIE